MQDRTETQKRPRGRPRAFDRDAVLNATAARFRTQGFSGTSLDDLAAATGVNRPSLNAAFGDKRALYLAALDRAHAWIEASLGTLLATRLPLREMLQRMFRSSINVYMSGTGGAEGCIALNTAVAEAATDGEIRASLSRILDMEDRMLRELLVQSGSAAPDAHRDVVVSVLQALSIRARTGRPREELEAVAASCVDLVAPA